MSRPRRRPASPRPAPLAARLTRRASRLTRRASRLTPRVTPRAPHDEADRPTLSATGLTRTFPGGGGVRGVDLSLRPGEVVALVGLNGAGKTTLMRLLLGMLRPQEGEVRIEGQPFADLTPQAWRRVGHQLGAATYPELTVRQQLRVAALLHRDDRSQVPRTLADWGLEPYADRRCRALSSGNRQRVGLAGALAHHPSLVVLDEPTTALDPAAVILLRDMLLTRARAGAAVLVSSHHLDEVARIADRILVLNAGRLIGALDPGGVDLERRFFDLVRADDADPEDTSTAGAAG